MARKKKKSLNKEMRTQIKGVLLLALALFAFIGLTSPDQSGGLGKIIGDLLRALAGNAALTIPVLIALSGLQLLVPAEKNKLKTRILGLIGIPYVVMIYYHLQLLQSRMPFTSTNNLIFESFSLGLAGEGGGLLGSLVAAPAFLLLGAGGSLILVSALMVIAVMVVLNFSFKKAIKLFIVLIESLVDLLKGFLNLFINANKKLTALFRRRRSAVLAMKKSAVNLQIQTTQSDSSLPGQEQIATQITSTGEQTIDHIQPALTVSSYQNERALNAVKDEGGDQTDLPQEERATKPICSANFPEYEFPAFDLLAKAKNGDEQQNVKNIKEQARLLESTLLSFGVKAKVVHVQSGPTVTRFELQPEAGVKVSRIISLSDDLALNLAAPLVRIEAPIPGKAALGIEVPNKVISLVNLREVMEDLVFTQNSSPLTIALGKDITGVSVIADLTKMPHLLIAGATGAGKSVCLNTIITSILYKAGPERVRFLMIDPKVVELSVYNGIPHLLMPVVTDPRKAALALKNMVREMSRRYELFAKLGVRDLAAYNQLEQEDEALENLSFIVVIIDELADLMLVSPGEVEDSIARLAQMSRAAGIHLLVATQRPSVDVLTGIIKANITSRIAFTVSSQFDSRTILDMAGAEKLLGRGDMLFYPVGSVKPFRVQGAYISEVEVKRITDFIKEQGRVEYEQATTFLNVPEEEESEEADALFAEAIDLVVRTGQASISLLQRRFRIGYTRAARLIDDLERRGIVGPFEGSKPREVMITADQAAQICKEFDDQKS